MEKTIYYYDTDAGGVVYYANYLKYLEVARTEFLAACGLSIQDIQQRGFLYAVRQCCLTYKSPARYGDVIVSTAKLIKVTAAQMVFEQKIFHKTNKRLLVEAQVTLVSLNHEFKPKPIPDDIKRLILSYSDENNL